jgi:phosphate-selective porin
MNSPNPGASPVARNRTGLEIVFLQSPFSINGECIFARDDQTLSSGWYVQGGYFIVGKLQSIVRYDSYDKNRDTAADRSDLLIFGLNWLFSDKTKLQVNYEWNKKEGGKFASSAVLAQFQAGF